ncbi:hypothetical protein AYO47_01590 [Planctomyces sp. SCGC AG-212-M04]|nr:hypothetical protein AYO47_01590 [Planctomyces sp. SCGC AG-212-M04]
MDLAKFLDPDRAILKACYVLPDGKLDAGVARDLPCPVSVATSESVQQAYLEHDLVISWGMGVDRLLAGRQRKAIGVHIAHGDSQWTHELIKQSRNSIDHVVAVSQRVASRVCRGFPTTVILNGVDTARIATSRSRDAVRSELGFEADDFVVGFVGRFSPEKRCELLLESLERLPRNFKALLIGWGPDYPKLLQLANDRLPTRCAFRFADSYLGDYYQAFDAFTLLSAHEGFALVLLEAMFCQLPVVATSVGAVPELVTPRVNGIIVNPCPDTIAAELSLLQQQSEWRLGIGRAAQGLAHQVGHARRMAEGYMTLFERLTSERR